VCKYTLESHTTKLPNYISQHAFPSWNNVTLDNNFGPNSSRIFVYLYGQEDTRTQVADPLLVTFYVIGSKWLTFLCTNGDKIWQVLFMQLCLDPNNFMSALCNHTSCPRTKFYRGVSSLLLNSGLHRKAAIRKHQNTWNIYSQPFISVSVYCGVWFVCIWW
jgi:hypothetical protein